jgi:arylformamidase
VLDIFPADRPGAPVQLYIHGGYWRGGSKDAYSFIAEPFVEAGVTMVLLEYDLCPHVTINDIVHEARSGIAWCYQNISRYGGDPEQLYISGSSAGGHLVAMALNHDWKSEHLSQDLIKGAVAITGVYDLDPVFHISVNEDIRLTPELARDSSPMIHPPHNHAPLVVAVGQSETPGWIQMSRDFFTRCSQRGVDCRYLEVPGAHHFSISSQLGDPLSVMTQTVMEQMGLPTSGG